MHTNLEYEEQNGLFNLYAEEMDVQKRGFSQLSILEQQILEYCKYKIPLQNLEEFLNRAGEFMDFLQEDTEQWVLPETEITEPYDEEKEYDKAFDALERVINTYPNSLFTSDAYLQMAKIYDKLVSGPAYDQDPTKNAISFSIFSPQSI